MILNVRREWEVSGLDVGGRLEGGAGPEGGGHRARAGGVDRGRHRRRQRRRLRRDEGAEVAARVAQRDGRARAERRLPQQRQVDTLKEAESVINFCGLWPLPPCTVNSEEKSYKLFSHIQSASQTREAALTLLRIFWN